ncbi:MAG: restriction endonuclease subunit S [Algoriphagus sp.]
MSKKTYSKYPAYKDSGVEWLGGIPEGWETSRLRNVFSFSKGLTITKENLQEEGVHCVNYGEIHSKFGFEVNPEIHVLKCVSEEYLISDSNSLLSKGDFVFADTSEDIDGSGNFTYLNSDIRTFAGYHTVIARLKIDVNERFAAYVITSQSFRNQIRRRVKGVKVFSITQSLLKTVIFWFPNEKEQIAIANFLDDKTAKIDRAIAQKEQLIALLKERKQIIIQNVVTKGLPAEERAKAGLDPKVKLKDSGVEWIGEIPEHWGVKKLKHLIKKSFSWGTPSTDKLEYWDGGIPWISSVDIKSDFLAKTVREISKKGLKRSSSNIAPKGSTVFVTRSGILQHTFAISILERDMAINQDIKCLVFVKDLFQTYFLRLIQGNNSKILVETRQQAATVESIDMDSFFNLQIPLPPFEEQKSIVYDIKAQSTKIEQAISLQQTQIQKLKEYKATLIDSVVTGKIKVD